MDKAVPSDSAVAAVADPAEDEEVKSLYDVPFVTVNRIGDEVIAEVLLSGVDETDFDRLTTAQSVAWENGGFRAYARVIADLYEDDDVLIIYFADSAAKGTIWGLENDVRTWL